MLRDVPPDTLVDGRYRVLGRVGAGGMADVYCAEDTQLGRRVALKLLHRRFAEDREFVERFRREASSAAGLQHPNVVGVYDRGEWDGTSYIAMEYLEGRTLKQVVDAEAPLDPMRAIDLATGIVRAARFAHRRGIIHRDLKPHNVIVDDEGRVKVTDFGIARAGASDMTQTGSIMGTAQYLSPEQAQGEPVTPQSDLYSIGIVLYELLTGRPPFDGESAVTIALKQVNEAPVPPSAHNPAVGPELEGIVLRLLEKDPARRFVDADELLGALEACRAHLAAGGNGGGATTAFAPPPPPLEPEPGEPRRRRWWWVAVLVALILIGAGVAAYLLTRPDQRRVPDVTGKPVTAALTVLQNAGFAQRVHRVTSDAPKDRVIAQSPEPRTKADRGSTVTLRVSNGPGSAPVPNVGGQSGHDARRTLRRAGFKVDVQRRASSTIDEGIVIATKPPSGTRLELNQTVTLVVSSGPPQAQVPSVIGSSKSDARSTLQAAGFIVAVSEREDPSAEPGTVLAQSPVGGSTVTAGSTITITVATAPTTTTVPNVTGESEAAAVGALSDAQLKANEVPRTVSDRGSDGVVLRQRPKQGKEVPLDSIVTLTIGHFRQPTTTTTTPTTTTPTTTTPTTTTPGSSGGAPPG